MRKKSLIKRKILFYLDCKGISKYEFYKNSSISRSTLDKDSGMSEDNIAKFIAYEPNINLEWLFNSNNDLTTNGMLKNSYEIETKPLSVAENIAVFPNKTDYLLKEQSIPVYDGTVTAGMLPVLDDINSKKPIDHLYIPNAPKCDGAIYAFGDSMYPLIKSGDLVAYKIIKDIKNDLYWGLKYILYIQQGDDVHRTIKFVKKGSDNEHINLVSENRHHGEKEIHISKVVAIAQVKLTVRID